MKRNYLFALIPTLFPGLLAAQTQKPNIIFLMADDAGYSDYQPYNEMFDIPDDVRIKTPNVARLAEEGLVFTNMHSTGSVCQPSRYSIMTGIFSFRKLVTGTPAIQGNPFIDTTDYTMPEMLRKNGYQTAIFGKWHLDYAYSHKNEPGRLTSFTNQLDHLAPLPLTPLDYGFDHAFWLDKGVSAAEWLLENRYIVRLDGEVDYNELHPDKEPWSGHKRWQTRRYTPDESFDLLPGDDKQYIGDILTDKALEYMEGAVQSDKPFFLFLSSIAPHTPHLPTDSINGVSLYDGARHFNGNATERYRQKMVYENDVILGQLMEQLTRLGIEDNTIVIFTSDNGPGAPGARNDGAAGDLRGNKGTIWEGGHKMPFIVKWPGVTTPGSTTNKMVSQVDLFATFEDVVATEIPKGEAIDSRSFYSLLSGEKPHIRDWVFVNRHTEAPYDTYSSGHMNIGARSHCGKKFLLHYLPDSDSYEFIEYYELNSDPTESLNLIGKPESKHVLDSVQKVFENEYGISCHDGSDIDVEDITGDLIFYIPFDEDLSDQASHVSVSHNGTPAYVEGKFGSAIALDGQTEFIDLIFHQYNPIDIADNDFTLAAWVNLDLESEYNINILFCQLDGNEVGRIITEVRRTDTGNLLSTFMGGSRNSSVSTTLNAREWMHVAVVGEVDSGSVIFYINGIQHEDAVVTGPFESNAGDFRIGANKRGVQFWAGMIDELYFFRRALAIEEISLIMKHEWDFTTSNKRLETSEPIIFFPNPSSGKVFFSNHEMNPLMVNIYDVVGKKLIEKEVFESIDVSAFTPGIYVLRIIDKEGNLKTGRLVKI